MELVPENVGEKDLRQEVIHRNWKAGYTDRDGQPMVRGVRSRVPSDQYRTNYVRIFGHE